MADKNEQNNTDNFSGEGEEIFGQELFEENELNIEGRETADDVVTVSPGSSQDKSTILSGISDSLRKAKEERGPGPSVSGGDIGADLGNAAVIGDEGSLGSNSMPDQDIVDSVAEPWGTEYRNDEPLDIDQKFKNMENKRREDDIAELDKS
ncbi:MAG TPA: DUF6335 family protein [bacterium]|nr:DUF6335 family protein [bacterium]